MTSDQGSGATPMRRSRRALAVLLGVAAILILCAGAGYWAVTGGPLRPARTPLTIYVVYGGPEVKPEITPDAGPTATPSATASPTDAASPSVGASEVTATARPAITPTPLRPDLAVGAYSNPWLRCGQPFHMTLSLVNTGEASTGRATVVRLIDTYGDRQSLPMDVAVPVLAPHEHFDAQWTLTIASGCGENHALVVTIDPGGLIAESNEPNNSGSFDYVLEHGPELWAPALTLNPPDPACGVAFTATIEIHNSGTMGSLDGLVRFVDFWNETEQQALLVSFPALPVEGSATVSRTFIVGGHCGVQHRMSAYIDSTNRVDEIRENNNVLSRDYTP